MSEVKNELGDLRSEFDEFAADVNASEWGDEVDARLDLLTERLDGIEREQAAVVEWSGEVDRKLANSSECDRVDDALMGDLTRTVRDLDQRFYRAGIMLVGDDRLHLIVGDGNSAYAGDDEAAGDEEDDDSPPKCEPAACDCEGCRDTEDDADADAPPIPAAQSGCVCGGRC